MSEIEFYSDLSIFEKPGLGWRRRQTNDGGVRRRLVLQAEKFDHTTTRTHTPMTRDLPRDPGWGKKTEPPRTFNMAENLGLLTENGGRPPRPSWQHDVGLHRHTGWPVCLRAVVVGFYSSCCGPYMGEL